MENKKRIKVQLKDLSNLMDFHHTISKFSGEAKLIKGRYECNAKSLMGLLALDINEPTNLEYDEFDEAELLQLVEQFIVKN
jgi:phosphotransferase system HPr-like phosphotransfer protein